MGQTGEYSLREPRRFHCASRNQIDRNSEVGSHIGFESVQGWLPKARETELSGLRRR